MRWIFIWALLVAVPWVGALGQQVDGLDGARALFRDGKFVEAADAAAAHDNASGYALAAESLAIFGYNRAPEDDKRDLFRRCWSYAEKAIERDPGSSEAHLQHAHCMGRYAQTIGVLEALNKGFAERIRTALDKSLRLDPNKVGAYLSLGAWHAEIVASAGLLAGLLYDASEEDAMANYHRALELAPDRADARLEFAIGLLTLDDEQNREPAEQALRQAIALAPNDAYGQIVRERAEHRLTKINRK